ncbi:methyltransferase domain-containing protein [Campylobacter majalis]|uniref:class I SAM-dependent methyltransferase n=1 Tax=Campylobacter majalis TaxID=2790656 RepID=UPI003D681062
MKKSLWDEKSSKYPRYSGNLGIFHEGLYLNLIEMGIEFKNKSLIDIGCGTGIWSLFFSDKCSEILGIDSSEKMLEILTKDATKFGVKNIFSKCLTWDEYNDDKHYDIALCSMSPAIKTTKHFEKFNKCAKVKIFINFNRPRHSDLLEVFFKHYGINNRDGGSASELKSWLQSNNISYNQLFFGESRMAKRSKNEALQNIFWHLEICGTKYSKKEVEQVFNSLYKNDVIEEKIDSLITLFVF